jgi:hypothetical protein
MTRDDSDRRGPAPVLPLGISFTVITGAHPLKRGGRVRLRIWRFSWHDTVSRE